MSQNKNISHHIRNMDDTSCDFFFLLDTSEKSFDSSIEEGAILANYEAFLSQFC